MSEAAVVTTHDCRKIVRAENVSALIVNGYLASTSQAENRQKVPLQYAQIDFCGSPTCERVFKAVRGKR
jgi:hypothetical protein